MSLLSYYELCELVERGVITGVTPDLINQTSIDITMGTEILVERASAGMSKVVDYGKRDELPMQRIRLNEQGYLLRPGEFILACSVQQFNLPNDTSAEYKMKSSMARVGLNHLTACWLDCGWTGSVLTLELVNVTRHHHIVIRPGDRIGQVVFFRHAAVPEHASYATRGRYNGDTSVMGAKR